MSSIKTDSAAEIHMAVLISPIRPVAALIGTMLMKPKAMPVQTLQKGSQ